MIPRTRSASSSTSRCSSRGSRAPPNRYCTAANRSIGCRLPGGSAARKRSTSSSSATARASTAYSGEETTASSSAKRRYPAAMRVRSASAMQAGSQDGLRRPRAPRRAGRLAGRAVRRSGAAALPRVRGVRPPVHARAGASPRRAPVPGAPRPRPARGRFPTAHPPRPVRGGRSGRPGRNALPAPVRPAAGLRRDGRRPLPAAGTRRLPAPDDRLGRALASQAWGPIRRAVGVGDVPGGVAVLDPDHPWSRDNNRLVLSDAVDADTVERSAQAVAANAGWPHRAASLLWPGADDVAADLARRGWNTEELLLMGRSPAPTPGGERAEAVEQREVLGFWERSWRRDLPAGPQQDRVVADLIGREHLNDRVVAVTDLVVREEGRVVASAQLRVDGATAAVDSVLTDPDCRGRGYGDAVLAAALDRAAAAGCDLVVLEARADDWPLHWYARRGFEALGSVWWVDRRG